MGCLTEEYVKYLNYWDSACGLPGGWFRKNKKESKRFKEKQDVKNKF